MAAIEAGRTVFRISSVFALALGAWSICSTALLAESRGSVTNLPIPRFVSLKAEEANVRRGPALSHKIDWVFKKRYIPLLVVDEFEHWRRVQDMDGAGGWIHYSLITGTRTVITTGELVDLHIQPDTASPITARLEHGVIAHLGKCDLVWCQVRAGGYRGWTPKSNLWGVAPDEIRE